jgi:hypothetical protein
MAVVRPRSGLLAAALLAVALHWACQGFVPAPGAQVQHQSIALRGTPATVAAAAASMPMAAHAADDLIDYNFAGETTSFLTFGFFVRAGAFTIVFFASYLSLTKLKVFRAQHRGVRGDTAVSDSCEVVTVGAWNCLAAVVKAAERAAKGSQEGC